MRRLAALILIVCSAASVGVAAEPQRDAEQLVHVMQLDRATLLGIQSALLEAATFFAACKTPAASQDEMTTIAA